MSRFFAAQVVALDEMGDGIDEDVGGNAGQVRGLGEHAVLRESAVALACQLFEGIFERRPGPERGIAIDAHVLGKLVGGLKADAPDVAGQAIRVLLHFLDGLVAVGLVDARGLARAEAVGVEEDHDVAHGLLLLPAFANRLDAIGADALDLFQERGAFVDDLQGAIAEDRRQSSRPGSVRCP